MKRCELVRTYLQGLGFASDRLPATRVGDQTSNRRNFLSEIGQLRHEPGRTFVTLDGLRGIAAIAVFMHHAGPMWGPILSPPGSYLAVDLFFLLSGFVLAHAYDRRFAAGMGAWGFMKARLIRLYPLYILACTLAVLAAILNGALGYSDTCYGRPLLSAAFFNAIFLPAPTRFAPGCNYFSLLIPAWSLSLELLINLLFGILWRFLTARTLTIVCVAAAGALAFSAAHFGSLDTGWEAKTFAGGIARVFFSFPLGVLLYRHASTWAVPRLSPWVLVAVAIVAFWTPAPDSIRALFDFLAALVAFPAIVLTGSRSRPAGRQIDFFLFFGAISYAIYLLHVPAFDLINAALTYIRHGAQIAQAAHVGSALAPEHREIHLHLIERYAPWTGLAFLLALIALCAAVDRFFDAPVRRWLSNAGTMRSSISATQAE